jgi:hypothetical protein
MELEKMTIKKLQEKLIELGMPEEDVMAFKSKAPLIASIKTIEAKEVVKEEPEEVKKVASIDERPNPSEDREVNRRWRDKAEKMKHHLLTQEQVSILIPLDPSEKAGVVAWKWEKGGQLTDEEWDGLTIEEKMKTHQVHISGGIESVQLNGYKYFMPKGKYVRVPRQVAEVISRAQQQTLEAGQNISIDRIDPNTGRPMSEIL